MNAPNPFPFELRSREPVKAGIRRLGDALADHVLAQTDPGPENIESAVHGARLSLKRLRATVRLISGALGEKKARRLQARLREAARALAPLRDVAVGVATLDGLAADLPSTQRSAAQFWRRRLEKSHRARTHQRGRIATHLKAAGRVIRSVSTSIDRSPWRLHGWETLETGLKDTYRRARRRFRAAHTTDDEASFHRWRTAVKAFFYQLCLIRPVAPKRLGPCIKNLDRLQKCLGDEHDLAVLEAKLRQGKATGKDAKGVDSKALRRLIASRQQRLRKNALKEGRRLFADRPKHFMGRLRKEWKGWHHPPKSTRK